MRTATLSIVLLPSAAAPGAGLTPEQERLYFAAQDGDHGTDAAGQRKKKPARTPALPGRHTRRFEVGDLTSLRRFRGGAPREY